jgi:predicted nucleic acid-binding protein
MREVFADTSGWASFFDRSQPHHSVAESLVKRWHETGISLVTTNFVLVELVALCTSPLRISRPEQIRILRAIRNTPIVEVVQVHPALEAEGWRLFESRPDKLWSLVDCLSFVLMKQRSIADAFSTDHHFEQAGFRVLLK